MPNGNPFVSREDIFLALWALLCSTKPPDEAGGEWLYQSRDLKYWDDVPAANQPALFMMQTPQHSAQDAFTLPKWRLGATAWVYYKRDEVSDPDTPRDMLVNKFIDALDSAINPRPGERQTLGGLVYHTFIEGDVVFDNGLTDQQAVILVPITMLVGAFGI